MKIVHTDGKNKDFIAMCELLDESIDEIIGNKTERLKFNKFNTLEHIKDAIIIYLDEKPVASGAIRHYNDDITELKRIFVKKEYRGHGLSKILLKELEEKAKNYGYKKIYLETGEVLTASMKLYKSKGFKVIANYPPYTDIPESICMEKLL